MSKNKIIKICDYIIEGGLLAITFFIPVIFDFTISSYNLIDLYKIIFFRVTLSLALLVYVIKIFIEDKLNYKGGNKIFLLAAWLGLSFFISSLFSIQPGQSFWGNFFRQQGFYNFFHYLLFFVLLILNLKEFKQIKRIIMAVIAAASLVSAYGLVQYFDLDPFYWTEGAGRIFSTLGQPNFLGHYLILVLPFSAYALFFMAKRFLARFFIGLAVFAQFFCLVFTYSRAAWLGFLGGASFLMLAWLIHKRRKKAALGFIGLILVGLMAIIGLNVIKPADKNHVYDLNLVNRLKSMADFSGGSNKMRFYYLESAVKEIRKASLGRLLAGFGPEALAGVFINYYQSDWGVYEAINTVPDRAHNWLFDQILALGFFGLMANLAFYIYFIYKAAGFLFAKQKFEPADWLVIFLFSALAGYFVNNFFSFSLFTVSVYLYLILAVIWFIINYGEKEKMVEIKLTNFSKLLIWTSLLAVSVLFIWTNNINQARAEIHYVKALKSLKSFDCPGVMNNLDIVISLNPNIYYYQENYLFLALNCFPLVDKKTQIELRDSMLKQIKLIENSPLYDVLINTARPYTMFGRYFNKLYFIEAEKKFNNLIANFPYLTTAYEDLGTQKMAQEDYFGAIDVYKRALEILPPIDHPDLDNRHRLQVASVAVRLDEGLGQAYFKTKNYDSALEYYKKGLKLDPYRATLYKDIADIYYTKGRLDEAIVWNKRGLMLNSSDYNWPLALSLLYRDKKDLTKAKGYLDQALKLAPENQDLKNYYKELNSKN